MHFPRAPCGNHVWILSAFSTLTACFLTVARPGSYLAEVGVAGAVLAEAPAGLALGILLI